MSPRGRIAAAACISGIVTNVSPHPFLALLLLAPVTAQELTGTVLGFDGKPAQGATIHFAGADTRLGEVLTDAAGRFTYPTDQPIRVVTAWIEGVRVIRPIATTDTDVTLSFANMPHVVFRARLVAPDDQPLPFADIRVVGTDADTALTATTDGNGAFALRLEQPARRLRIDPLGWAIDVQGPFDHAAETRLDLRTLDRDWFAISGRIRDELGKPVAAAKVAGRRRGLAIASTKSRADGTFTLWSTRPFTELAVRDRFSEVAFLDGEFTTTATVPISTRDHGYTTVVGRVVDEGGKGVAGATLHAVVGEADPDEHDPPIAGSGRGGWFRAYLPLVRRTLFAHTEAGAHGRATWHIGVEPTIVVR